MKRSLAIGVVVVVCLLAWASGAVAAEFKADMVQGHPGQTTRSRLYVQGDVYRMEMEEEGRPLAVIVDRSAGKTFVLLPEEQAYLSMENDSMRSARNNPFLSYRLSAERYDTQELGRETLQGFACRKVRVTGQGEKVMTAWVSEELGFPLKIVNHLANDMPVALEKVVTGPVDDALFEVPDGYTPLGGAAGGTAPPSPGWTEEAASAPERTPPFERELEEGAMVRIPVKPGFHIRLGAKNLSEGRASFTAVAFRDGRPVHDPGKRTYGMGRKGQGLKTLHKETPGQADAVVARAARGAVGVTAEYVEAPQGLSLEKGDVPERSGKELHPVEGRAVRLVLRDDPSDGKPTRGSLSVYQGRAQHKEKLEDVAVTLENGAERVWVFPADRQVGTLNVDVWQGGVAFRMEQPRGAGMPEDWKPVPGAEAGGEKPSAEEQTAAAAEPAQAAETQAGTGAAAPAAPETETPPGAPNILFILDASGSMWGEVEGRDKIAIAKEVMTELIRELPDRSRVGLVAYGHRRKGDCADVEELVPVSPLDRDRLTRTVQALSPKGKTPITRSVRTAAEKLKVLEDETTIVLVSDGKETCEGDPCALVRELKEAGLRFVLHVIGFDVTEAERSQLECMADAGGGTYYTAQTAHAFRAAAREVVRERPKQGALLVTALRDGEPFRAMVELFPAGEREALKRGHTGVDPDRPGATVKPGTYDVRVWDENLSSKPEVWLRGVTVEAGRTTEKEAVFEPAGVLELAVTKEGEPFDAGVRVFPAGSGHNVVHASLDDGEGRYELDPGAYDVVLQDPTVPGKPEIRLQDVPVEAGRTTREEVAFETSGVLELAATKGGEPFRAKVRVYPVGSDHNVVHASLRDGVRSWELAAGTYDVLFVDESVPSEPEVRLQGVRVEGGRTTRKEAAFPENGLLELAATKGGEPFRAKVRVYPEGRDNNVVHTRLREEPRQFELAAGTYDVLFQDMEAEGKPEVWVRGVVLAPGETVREEAEFAP